MSDQNPPKPNPVRDSKNKVKLAVFAINGQGAAFTFHPDRFNGSWDANVRLAKMADKLGFEAFVSAAHWKSFGGDGHYSGDLMETFTWAGGIAAVTEQIAPISTVHLTLNNPVFVAKAEATVDLISNGRAGMNLVLGWYKPEMDMFGYELPEHSDRFQLGDEWIEVFDRLWVGEPAFDFKGEHYNLKGLFNQPSGVQKRPVLLNAGASPRGREFAAKHCDIAFVRALNPDPAYVSVCFGATLGGAVFGDQCSPISDTTILSSMFTGCDLMDHVKTQLPLAFVAALLGVACSTALLAFT